MWPASNGDRPRLVAVAIDKAKSSQVALKWAIDNLLQRGQTVILIHVNLQESANGLSSLIPGLSLASCECLTLKEIFLPFRVFCTRKEIRSYDVVIDDTDVARALVEFVKQSSIDLLVLGATTKGGIFRFNVKDTPATVSKGVPDFCTVYAINKGKISSTRTASRPAPAVLSPIRQQIMDQQAKNLQTKASTPPILHYYPLATTIREVSSVVVN